LNGTPFQLGVTTSGVGALVTDSRSGSFVGSFDIDGGKTSILRADKRAESEFQL